MSCYSFLGLHVELPWILEATPVSAAADVDVVLQAPEALPALEGEESLEVRRSAGGLELLFDGLCRMSIRESDGIHVRVVPSLEADIAEVQRQVLEHLVPRLLSRTCGAVLHASSVLLAGGVAGFVAPSGAGKSTLAFALARRGAPLCGDDSLVIDAVDGAPVARPLWSSVRLYRRDLADLPFVQQRQSSRGRDKVRVGEGDDPELRFSREAHPLKVLYLLDGDEALGGITITKANPREALLCLLRQAYHLEFDHLSGMDKLIARILQLGLPERTYWLSYPRDYQMLDELCERVRSHAAGL